MLLNSQDIEYIHPQICREISDSSQCRKYLKIFADRRCVERTPDRLIEIQHEACEAVVFEIFYVFYITIRLFVVVLCVCVVCFFHH